MKKIVSIKFSEVSRLTVAGLIEFGREVVMSLTENSDVFPSPPYTPAILGGAIDTLESLNTLSNSDEGSNRVRNQRDGQKESVLQMLLHTGVYVASVANAKPTYIEKKAVVELANYTVAGDTDTPVPPVQVTGLKVQVPTIPGQRTIKARWRRGKCNTFLVYGTQGDPASPATVWEQLKVVSKAQCELTLTPGQWSLRVVGMYPTGAAEPSNNVQFVIS
ncbi:MAG TPA: hypothetical protein VNJ07_14245 [Chitinophagales bacterium]|nr:hypothetical protein [Chitinophagales bacterium]